MNINLSSFLFMYLSIDGFIENINNIINKSNEHEENLFFKAFI